MRLYESGPVRFSVLSSERISAVEKQKGLCYTETSSVETGGSLDESQENSLERKRRIPLQNESMEVFVNPADGMNIYQIDWEGRHMIDWEEARYQRKATYGVPVLYPTPNRSENLKIQAYGKQYDARIRTGEKSSIPGEDGGNRWTGGPGNRCPGME